MGRPRGKYNTRSPKWWAAAREMRRQGATYDEISAATGYSFDAVRYAVNDTIRDAALKRMRARAHANL